jgi:DNA-binding transcriptional MerR regulator
MKYKISEFCRILGVSPDTLRYYERCSLLSTSKNPENNYRTFTRKDALDIWNLHMLRSLDMGLRDIEGLRLQGTIESQTKHLHMRENALTNEIERLIAKRDRLRQLTILYDAVQCEKQVHFQKQNPANYALFVLGDGCRPNEKIILEISHWVSSLPFTYIAVEISLSSLIDQSEDIAVCIGLGILEENLEKTGLVPPNEAVYTSQGPCVFMKVCTNDVFSLRKKDLTPLYAFLEENHMHITGPASGRIICSNCKAEKTEYILGFFVPVNM